METDALSKGEQTRNQIIEAGYDLFINQGYHGTSMREIASKAGIALGGIYNHFATKEEIFFAVFSNNHPILQLIPAVKLAKGDTVEALLKDIAGILVEGLNKHPGFISLLMIDIVEFQCRFSSLIIKQELDYLTNYYEFLVDSAGGVLRSIPPLIIARSFFGLFFSYYMTGTVLNNIHDLPDEINEGAFDYFVDIYLHGILEPGKMGESKEA